MDSILRFPWFSCIMEISKSCTSFILASITYSYTYFLLRVKNSSRYLNTGMYSSSSRSGLKTYENEYMYPFIRFNSITSYPHCVFRSGSIYMYLPQVFMVRRFTYAAPPIHLFLPIPKNYMIWSFPLVSAYLH